jgi:undecaprenyl pyrophosphate phosphatase UppP
MDMSYQEKSILGSLLALIIAYGSYFSSLVRHWGDESDSLGRLVLAVIVIVVIETVYNIVLALESKPQPKDERDAMIASKAYRNAYFFLYFGAGLIMTCALGLEVISSSPSMRITVTPFLILNTVLAFMVVAELVKFLTQLFYYRRGLR